MSCETEIQNSTNQTSSDHVLLLPFMAQGHLIPFMALAQLLSHQTTHTITIINTPLNIQRLRSSLPPNSTIRFSSLPFNSSDHGLPPNIENTDTLPSHLFLPFLHASESLQPAFHHLLSTIPPPLCIISDEFMSWSVESAKKFNIFHAIFNTSGAYGTALFMSVWTHLPHKQTEADEFALPDFPDTTLRRSDLTDVCKNADESDPWTILFRKHMSFLEQSNGVLVNTVEEFEKKALENLRKDRLRRVWAIGPLLPPPRTGLEIGMSEWLNLHPPDSVLYISFGSQSSVGSHQMMEMAKGLESSGCAFIWVIRPPVGFDVNGEFRTEWLPEGFEERITEKKQGILVRKWAPQMEILSHRSTGGFISHCGWNSVLESLSCGVPIIGWPMSAEQPFNLKLLVDELGVGVEIARGNKMEIYCDDVARVIGWVMDGESEKGMEMRRKAKQIQEVMKTAVVEEEGCKGSSIRAIEDFIQTALSRKENH